MEVQGEIAIGEASRFAGTAARRLNGFPAPTVVYGMVSFTLMVVLIVLFAAARSSLQLPEWAWAPAVLAILWISIFAGVRACRARGVQIARKAFAKRGLTNPVPSRFIVQDDGFAAGTGRVTSHASWEAVSDLFPAGPYWVVLVEGHAHYLPKRFFASPDEEKAFLRAILDRMLPEARARSSSAVGFVGDAARAG